MKYRIEKIKQDSKAMQRLYMVSFAAAILLFSLVVRDMSAKELYIKSEDGSVQALQWDEDGGERRLVLNVESEGENESRDITIRRRADDASTGKLVDEKEKAEAERENEINNIINEIEFSRKKRISLPRKLSDGSKLRWEARDDEGSDYFLIPLMYLILVCLIVKSSLDTPKDVVIARRNSIIRGLPRFCNQLLLTMNAGMILSDAFEKICSSYELIPENKRTFFEQSMIDINQSNSGHRTSTAQLLSEYAQEYNVKEMMRIATILTENERRGSDVIESLERESAFLWESRKTRASERGKALDAKMAYPLGVLLLILIVITIAPAFLTM